MKFKCPSCAMSLKAEPEWAGKVVRCPGCNTKLQIPEFIGGTEGSDNDAFNGEKGDAGAAGGSSSYDNYSQEKPQRTGWTEEDPTNPNGFLTFGLGLISTIVIFAIFYPFIAPAAKPVAEYTTMEFMANLLFKHFTVSFLNVMFFCWAMAIVYFKIKKLKHQKEALFLDVLPMELGREITSQNVGNFIDHVYNMPVRLRDSLMVNRIRKALELFEVKSNTGDVSHAMDSQSNIDSARIGASYTMLKAFLWAIPLLGFIGTVIGLSHAIGGMNFANVEEVSAVIDSINNVTSGLGTAFDATLLGLVLAVILNFPMNALMKAEDEMLNNIDAFCNEVLLPRLQDGAAGSGGDAGTLADSLVKAVAGAQKEFLVDLNELSKRMNEYASNLDRRSDAFQSVVTKEFVNNNTILRNEMQATMKDSLRQVSQYVGGLEAGLRGLNEVLSKLGENQVVIHQEITPKKKGWFSRG